MSFQRTLKKVRNKLRCSETTARAIVCKNKRNCKKYKQRVVYVRPTSRYRERDIERFFNSY